LSNLPVSAEEAFRQIVKLMFEGIFTTDGRKKYRNQLLKNETLGEI